MKMRVRESCSAIAVLLFRVLLVLQSPSTQAQRTCTETKTGYRPQAFTAYRSEGTSYSTSCGWFGWRRCRGTRYYSVSYTAYCSVAYYYTGCCSGYSGSNCDDVDECRSSGTNTCHHNAACANTQGSYTCTCNTGYQGNGFTCQDVNECATNNGGCHHNCHNTVGSYHCSCNNHVLNADGHMCEVPPQQPTNLSSSNVGARSARLEWQAHPVEFLNSLTRISSYRVTCSQSNFDSANIVTNTSSDTRWYVLQGTLEEHTQYTCNVKARNSFGLGNASQSIQFTTLQAAPSSPPQELSATVESPVSFLLTWSPPPPIDINGIILYYEVVEEEVESGDVSTLSSTVLQQRVDTHPYYHYRCKVAAFTIAKGPYTVNIEVQAPESVPSVISTDAITVDRASDMVTWSPPGDPGGELLRYEIRIRQNWTIVTTIEVSANRTAYNLATLGLQPGVYEIQIRGVTAAGPGEYSAPVEITVEDNHIDTHTSDSGSGSDSVTGLVIGLVVMVVVVVIIAAVAVIIIVGLVVRQQRNTSAPQQTVGVQWSKVSKSRGTIPTRECRAYGVAPHLTTDPGTVTRCPDELDMQTNAAHGTAQHGMAHQGDPDDGVYEVILY